MLYFAAISQQKHITVRLLLFNIPLHDYIAVLFIEFNRVTDTFRLFAGGERTSGTAEGIQHDRVAHARIHYWIRNEWHRLHGWVVVVFLGFVELPDGCFLTVSVPLVLAGLLPAEQNRLVLPLVRRAPLHQRLLLPDAVAGQIKTGIRKGPAEVQPFGVGVKNI